MYGGSDDITKPERLVNHKKVVIDNICFSWYNTADKSRFDLRLADGTDQSLAERRHQTNVTPKHAHIRPERSVSPLYCWDLKKKIKQIRLDRYALILLLWHTEKPFWGRCRQISEWRGRLGVVGLHTVSQRKAVFSIFLVWDWHKEDLTLLLAPTKDRVKLLQ